MRVAGGVLLRLEQRVKVPEGGLHVVVGGHLLKPHLREDLAELRAHLQAAGREGCKRGGTERVVSRGRECRAELQPGRKGASPGEDCGVARRRDDCAKLCAHLQTDGRQKKERTEGGRQTPGLPLVMILHSAGLGP